MLHQMTLSQFFSAWKSKPLGPRNELNQAYIEGFSSGFETGLKMVSEVDKQVIHHIKSEAIDEALRRLNGSNKAHN